MNEKTNSFNSARFGKISYSEKQTVFFKDGLLGFENHRNFFVFIQGNDSVFYYLQSLDDPGLVFIISDPRLFVPDYALVVSNQDFEELAIENESDLEHWVIITVPEKLENMTANLQGPVIINKKNRQGKQVISLKDDYTTKYKIIRENQK
ncbi:MAG: hypothetical protein A2096_07470 [Spirochaetes bacterium GWF1_41_5]|nr:MAG: hypothetical protein A2096_07470 [Spirochaetes bacterium GWF1_41_5]HBE02387.1 flagellar assembly protein FliW [Spirochaetia bacterium]